jgi:DNA-binding SARP family transcriptional activator
MLDARSGQRVHRGCVRLLGGFEVSWDEGPVVLPGSARRLLAFLALHPKPIERMMVAGTLWIDATERHSCASLRSALWRLHQPGLELVEVDGSLLRLAPEISVDSHELAARARRLLDADAPCDARDLSIAGMDEDLLPDWYDEWVVIEREALRQLRLHALESLADRLTVRDRVGEALQAGLAAVRAEPLRESAHRAVMRAHIAEGNYVEALRQYEGYKQLVGEELAISPSPLMEQMVDALRVTTR